MLYIVKDCNKPEFCVITPLRVGDKISKDTKVSVKRNKKPFIWATYQSNENTARNFKLGLQELSKKIKLPRYTIKVDNDTIWNRRTIDYMVETFDSTIYRSDIRPAYCYCSFEYTGAVNKKFPADHFRPDRLRKMNYISSNSLFLTEVLLNYPIIDDDRYKRLLDWAYYLHLLNNGFVGIPCKSGYFKAIASPDSVSAGGQEDFKLKYKRVIEDFVMGGK